MKNLTLLNPSLSCICVGCFVDIQEFYEVTLLNSQKSREQKLEEVKHMAEQWERSSVDPEPARSTSSSVFCAFG
uniref:Uncharacterized protein n=1 Tax=Periophthalmus magnuspinnatus TaxID=409849 RepID=A0A3B3Z663_9GOBI